MSRLITVQQDLAETTGLLRSCETAIASEPTAAELLRHDVRSLAKLQRQLYDEFSAASKALFADECRYRLFRDGENPSLAPVASILSDFQQLVSLVFHSLEKQMPLGNASLDASTIAQTSFQIGYTFEGSVGFVLTLPNERLVTPEMKTLVDESIDEVFLLSKLTSKDDVRGAAEKFGRPVVKACYRWATRHVENQLGSDVEWRRGKSPRSKLFVQYQELSSLCAVIDESSKEETDTFDVPGILTAADITAKTFRFSIDQGDEIRGTFDDAINKKHKALIPSRCTATIKKTTTINYALDETKSKYSLLKFTK